MSNVNSQLRRRRGDGATQHPITTASTGGRTHEGRRSRHEVQLRGRGHRGRGLGKAFAAAAAAAAGIAFFGSAPASAHVTIAENEHAAGSYTLLTFGVPHGCDGSPTTEMRIQLPEPITAVTPTVNPNWDVDVVTEDLDEPISGGHDEEITERASEVVYTAHTPLPDDLRDAFVLSLRIPEDAAGETLYFPTVQTCEQGEHAWIEIPGPAQSRSELEEPAPSIAVIAPDDGDAHGADEADPVSDDGIGDEGDAPSDDGDTPAADDDGSGSDGAPTGLAIAALVAGIGGVGLGGTALVRQRRP